MALRKERRCSYVYIEVVMIKKDINELKTRWDYYQHGAISSTHWTERNYSEYNRNVRARYIKDFYHGSHIAIFESSHSHPLNQFGTWLDTDFHYEMGDWCQENCKDEWHTDIYRVIKTFKGEWKIDDDDGTDVLVFAFRSQEDAVMFTLKWS